MGSAHALGSRGCHFGDLSTMHRNFSRHNHISRRRRHICRRLSNSSGGLQSCNTSNGLPQSCDVIVHVLGISIAKIMRFSKRVIVLIIITVIGHEVRRM